MYEWDEDPDHDDPIEHKPHLKVADLTREQQAAPCTHDADCPMCMACSGCVDCACEELLLEMGQ